MTAFEHQTINVSQPAAEPPGQFDRLPPHSIEAEMCLIASVMLERDAWDECRTLVGTDSFYQGDHQILWNIIGELYARGPVDSIILREELLKRHIYEEVGGKTYIAELLGTVPSARHAMSYAKTVAEKCKLRRLIALGNDVIRLCYAPTRTVDAADEIAGRCEREVGVIRDSGSLETIRTAGQIVDEVIAQKMSGAVSRHPFYLTDLDELTGGAPIGGLTYVSGRAGMGKSQLLKQVLLNNAMEGRRAGLVSIEETGSKIGENLLSNRGGVENSRIVYNRLDQDEWGRIEKARNVIADLPLFIDDAQFRISSIVATIRRLVKRHGCQVVGVDHLHLIDGETDANRTQEVTAISRTLKNTFKSLGVAGVVALQMNRRGAAEQDAKPELDQLRDSEALVFDGDLILQLHRRDYYEWKKAGSNFVPDHRLEVYVNKNKGGPVGSRELYFDGDTQSVGDWNGGSGPNAPAHVPEYLSSAFD